MEVSVLYRLRFYEIWVLAPSELSVIFRVLLVRRGSCTTVVAGRRQKPRVLTDSASFLNSKTNPLANARFCYKTNPCNNSNFINDMFSFMLNAGSQFSIEQVNKEIVRFGSLIDTQWDTLVESHTNIQTRQSHKIMFLRLLEASGVAQLEKDR